MQSIFRDITSIIHFFHENQIDKLVYKVPTLTEKFLDLVHFYQS